MSTKISLFLTLLAALMLTACTPKPAEEHTASSEESVAGTGAEVIMPSEEAPAGTIEAPKEQAKGDLPAAELALFDIADSSVPALKQLVASLNADSGVVSAKLLDDTKQLQVTFKPGETNPHKMLQALQGVDTKATLAQVKAVDGGEKPAGHAGCGGCPKADSCNKH